MGIDTEDNLGGKLKNARLAAGLTQELAAEKLGVSRQTVSNWENIKTYPDIMSAVKMSELYNVSLDTLLKGDDGGNDYLDYLEKATDSVRSGERLSNVILLTAYFLVWAAALIVFWFFTSGSDAMGYSVMFLWILLPLATAAVSLVIGICDRFGRKKPLLAVMFGFMYTLAEYATFGTANMANTGFHKINSPSVPMLIAGFIISVFFMAVGTGIRKLGKIAKRR